MDSASDITHIRFSVIIPAYNAEATLSVCLKALHRQSIPKEYYEVIVIDDGSIDGTSEIARRFNVKYIYQANQGPATARNRGVQVARGDIILFTDSDCVPDSRWIEEMVKPFCHADVIGVKGAYKTLQKELTARFVQAEFEDRYDLLLKCQVIDMIDTYSAAFKRHVFIKMGGFDKGFTVANNEDTDFSYRLATKGYKLVFNPNAFVYHFHPNTLFKYLKTKFWRGYWRMVVYRRYPDKAVKDSYTPSVIKIQTIIMSFSLIFFLLAFFIPIFFYLVGISESIIIVSSFQFSLKAFKCDKKIGSISPFVVLLRSLAFSLGAMLEIAIPPEKLKNVLSFK